MSADNWAACPKCGTTEELRDQEGTLREDYEQGILNGYYGVDYSAFCKRCGFEYRFEHEEKVDTQ